MERYKRGIAKAYNKVVRFRTFEVGQWVLRKKFNANKLDEAWKEPYQIIKVIGCGLYQLQDELGKAAWDTWNVSITTFEPLRKSMAPKFLTLSFFTDCIREHSIGCAQKQMLPLQY